jgi:hypothetical protein
MHGRGPEPLQLDHFGKPTFLIVRTGLQIGWPPVLPGEASTGRLPTLMRVNTLHLQ